MTEALLQGWLLGLATGAACLGTCAPALLPWLVSGGRRTARESLLAVLEFLAGRLAAYLFLGLLAGWLGSRLTAWPPLTRLAGLALLVLAVMLLAHGLAQSFPGARGCRALCGSRWLGRTPLAAGVALGLSPCVPLSLGLTRALGLGPWRGAGLAAAFFLGTTLWLAPLVGLGTLGRHHKLCGMAEVATVLSGVWFGWLGVHMLCS
ncbi:MAG: sulfite exporter TauE/SafE family protein [Armatimonadetes bacterium]|nr:sulfite exporter TauE/SafE family protein [Armatimonadota bacterium]